MRPMFPSWIKSSKGNPNAAVFLGNRDHESQVALGQLNASRLVAGPHSSTEVDLLFGGKELPPPDAL